MEFDLSQFRETFFQEAAEHLQTMESGLLSLRPPDGDPEILNAIFRGAHSMKAGAGTFGFDVVGRFTHTLESLLDRMRSGEVGLSAKLTDLLLRSVDLLRALLDSAASGGTGVPPEMEELVAQLSGVRDGGPDAPPKADTPVGERRRNSTEYAIEFEPGPEVFRLGLDPLLVLRDVAELGRVLSVEADLRRLPPVGELEPEECYLAWRIRLQTSAGEDEVRDVFAFFEGVAEVSVEAVAEHGAGPSDQPRLGERASSRETSIRVSSAKVDRLIDLLGELMIAQSVATQIMDGYTPDRLPHLQEAMTDIERYTLELQERAMRIRMLPMGTIFNRFPRLVHDTAQALGKDVELRIGGEETELDKGMVERIADPLTHLVRNAVDHGIELPEDRRGAGKPAQGLLRLSAFHQGGNVVIEVADDGRGLDTARIRRKGIERGLIAAEDDLTDEQIQALIFRAGFSTAERVSDLSGRGVGMDVVKRSVDALNGTVSLESAPGKGTCFRIRLPLTLAILDAMLLKVGEQTYVLPLVSIIESIQPRREHVRAIAGQGEVITVRGEPLPLLRLHRIFNVATEITDPARGLVVIIEHGSGEAALLVDEILGQQQVVVKSLETNFRKVEGITGATILGDGRAALILDVAEIMEMSRTGVRSAAA